MKRIQYDRYGGPELMQLVEYQLPAPGKGQIAVTVKAASINPVDWKIRNGMMKFMTGKKFPRAMGMDFAGVVAAVGPAVARLRVGDEVFGQARMKESGAFAPTLITDEKLVTVKPAGVAFEQAACLPTAAATAWIGLVNKARLRSGQRVFVNGCSGGVGQSAVQIARHMGASVAGSCSAAATARASSLGVDPALDYATLDLAPLRGSFDVVYDTAGTMTLAQGRSLLKRGGVFLDINPSAGKIIPGLLSPAYKLVMGAATPAVLDELGRAAAAGTLHLDVGRTVAIDQAIALIASLEKGQRIGGKGVIRFD